MHRLRQDACQRKGNKVNHLAMKALVVYTLTKTLVSDRLYEVTHDEKGEIGSWMILAAGLAAAAVAAMAILTPWFSDKASDITAN